MGIDSIHHSNIGRWVRCQEVDSGMRNWLTSDERLRMKELDGEKRELRRANEILRKASAFSHRQNSTADGGDNRVHRCAPRGLRARADLQDTADRSITYCEKKAREKDPSRLPARTVRDRFLVGD